MTNEQMKPSRFMKWNIARQKYSAIVGAIHTGRVIVVSTYTRAWQFDKLSACARFKATKSGLWMRLGKNWDNIDYAKINIWS